jgi:hypothetical protein
LKVTRDACHVTITSPTQWIFDSSSGGNMSTENQSPGQAQTPSEEAPQREERSWVEEIEVASDQLVARIKELIAEGNVRRLILRGPEGKILLEIPLTAGVAVGGVVTLFAPVLAAVGALAALIAHVKVEIVREGEPPSQ